MQSRPAARERGAILIMTALFMIVALMMVAMAVDMGQMRSKRAQFQHVADAASLYGGYQVNNGVSYAVAEVALRDFVRQNLGLASSAWDGCTDVKHLPSFTPGNECISFDYGPSDPANPASPRQYFSRVRIPPQQVDFSFAPGSGVVTASAGVDGNTAVCDPLDPGVCVSISTTTTTPTTTRPPTPTTTRPLTPTTTRPPTPTTTRPAVTSTTRPPVTSTTRPRVTTTTRPAPTTTRPPTPTTTRPPTPTTTRPAATTTTRPPVTTTTLPPPSTTIDISF